MKVACSRLIGGPCIPWHLPCLYLQRRLQIFHSWFLPLKQRWQREWYSSLVIANNWNMDISNTQCSFDVISQVAKHTDEISFSFTGICFYLVMLLWCVINICIWCDRLILTFVWLKTAGFRLSMYQLTVKRKFMGLKKMKLLHWVISKQEITMEKKLKKWWCRT